MSARAVVAFAESIRPAESPSPAGLPDSNGVELAEARHMAWIKLTCRDCAHVAVCLAAVPRARLVDGFAIALLDRHIKDRPAPLLDGLGTDLLRYRVRR